MKSNSFSMDYNELMIKIKQTAQHLSDCSISGEIDRIEEVKILCKSLDRTRLFICAVVDSVGKADNMIKASKI